MRKDQFSPLTTKNIINIHKKIPIFSKDLLKVLAEASALYIEEQKLNIEESSIFRVNTSAINLSESSDPALIAAYETTLSYEIGEDQITFYSFLSILQRSPAYRSYGFYKGYA
jgi:CMP-N-acetylneuraminic acid synthetase